MKLKQMLSILVIAAGLLADAHADIPVQVRSSTSNAETVALIAALKALIERHPDYRTTGDVSELHVVISVSVVSNNSSLAMAASLELRPPGASIGILTRAPLVITTPGESLAMIPALYHKLLIEDKMVDKLLFMRRMQINPGDLNQLSQLMLAAREAAARGRI